MTQLLKKNRFQWVTVRCILAVALLLILLIQWNTSMRIGGETPAAGPLKLQSQQSSNRYEWFGEETRMLQQSFPPWLQNYTKWHRKVRLTMNPQNWNATGRRYLIMTCLSTANSCGGLSDRLQHIPAMVKLASMTNRLLLIHWETPASLTHFLLPRQAKDKTMPIIDWRIPDWLVPNIYPIPEKRPELGFGCVFVQKITTIEDEDKNKKAKHPVVCARSTIHRKGQTVYDEWRSNEQEQTFKEIYHSLWNYLFLPSPPVAAIIKSEMNRLHLRPGRYVMAHIRALYGVHERDSEFIRQLARNAIQCARRLVDRFHAPDTPIFVASDSSLAVKEAVQYGNGTVVSVSHRKPVLHLDRANSTLPSDYYSVFVDLYLLGNSRCATFNVGGFGRWGALIGFSQHTTVTNDDFIFAPCWIEHHKRGCDANN